MLNKSVLNLTYVCQLHLNPIAQNNVLLKALMKILECWFFHILKFLNSFKQKNIQDDETVKNVHLVKMKKAFPGLLCTTN